MSMKVVKDPYGNVHGPFSPETAESLAADLVRHNQGEISGSVSIEDAPTESPRIEVHLAGERLPRLNLEQIDEILTVLGRRLARRG